MAPDVHIRNRLFDLRHVAADTFAARGAGFVVRVLLDGRRPWPVARIRAVALQAHGIRRLQEIGIVCRSMNIMAAKAGHSVRVHRARDEIISLHPVLVRGAVREVRESRLAELVFLQFPELPEIQPDMEANGPVVILPLDRAFGWTAQTIDGHNFSAMEGAFSRLPAEAGRPTAVIARTVRGKGLPSIERRADRWFVDFTPAEIEMLLAELHGQAGAELTSEALMVR